MNAQNRILVGLVAKLDWLPSMLAKTYLTKRAEGIGYGEPVGSE